MRTEIIKTLAEKVMGWERNGDGSQWITVDFYGGASKFHGNAFDPFTNSADNDALIEAFVGKYKDTLIRVDIDYGECQVNVTRLNDDGTETSLSSYTTAKKNEAVCKAIYEAIK